jgi:DHA1 family multidrug resistance protein-like MFS transporter
MKSWKRTLYIMFYAQIVTAIGFSSVFPFLPLYVAHLGTRTHMSVELLAGLVFSAQAFTMMIASPFWGALADRWGRKIMVNRAMFGGALLVLLMGYVQSAEQLVLLRAIQGLVTGVIGAANALVAAAAPRERTGFAMGLLQVGMNIGLALGPVIGGLVAELVGYRATFFVTSFLLLTAGVLVLFGVKENFNGFRPADQGRAGFFDAWQRVLAGSEVRITYGIRFVSQLGRMMLIPVLPLFIQLLVADTTRLNIFTGFVVGAGSAAMTGGALALGRLGDRIGHRRIVIASTLAASVFYWLQSLVTTGWQLLMFHAMAGIALGGIVPSISALLVIQTQEGSEGSVFGLDHAVNAGARAAAPLMGAGVALWLGLRATFAAAGLLFLFAGVSAMWSLPRRSL